MKRFPNGVAAPPFYQHRAPDVPAGVRTAGRRRRRRAAADHRRQPEDAALHDAARGHLAGSVVLARRSIRSSPTTPRSISIRPTACRSRACSTSRAGFATSSTRSAPTGVPKTSGADGLHIYMPLPAGTPYEAGLLFCQIVATRGRAEASEGRDRRAEREGARQARLRRLPAEHPRQDAGDRLQRARQRLRRRVDAADVAGGRRRVRSHAISRSQTAPARFEKVGDLWAELRKSKGVDLKKVARLANRPEAKAGAPDWIRTSGLQLRRLSLYPAELRAHVLRLS